MNIVPAIQPKNITAKGKVNIKIRISHNRKVRDIGTEYYIDPVFWLASGRVSDDYPKADYLNLEILKLITAYWDKLLGKNLKVMPINRIVEILRAETYTQSDFSAYFKKVTAEKARTNQRTGEIFQSTLDKIRKFDKRSPLMFEDISAGWLKKFEGAMKQAANSKATMSLHFRNVRTVFNDAIDNSEISLNLYPFRRFKIKSGSEEKPTLTLQQARNLARLPHELKSRQNACNVWLLSFCLIGMNSSDLFDAKPEDIIDGRIQYSRNKTGKKYFVKLEPEASDLIEKLKGEKNLLNLSGRFKHVKSMTTCTDNLLKEIGKKIGKSDLHMYDARHAWASMAKNHLKVDDNDISAALGHSIGGVTAGYIHRNQEYIDSINRKILDAVFKDEEVKKRRGMQKKKTEAS
jgi:integrase